LPAFLVRAFLATPAIACAGLCTPLHRPREQLRPLMPSSLARNSGGAPGQPGRRTPPCTMRADGSLATARRLRVGAPSSWPRTDDSFRPAPLTATCVSRTAPTAPVSTPYATLCRPRHPRAALSPPPPVDFSLPKQAFVVPLIKGHCWPSSAALVGSLTGPQSWHRVLHAAFSSRRRWALACCRCSRDLTS